MYEGYMALLIRSDLILMIGRIICILFRSLANMEKTSDCIMHMQIPTIIQGSKLYVPCLNRIFRGARKIWD
jgi:hypothetical protein